MDVLRHGLGNIGHALEAIFKKSHRPFMAVSRYVLPHGLGNFGHDHSLEKFDVNWGSF